MYQLMKKYIDPIIPLYGIIPLLSCFALNMLVYSGTMILCADMKHYDFTTTLDTMVPVVPEWMFIYFGCYAFWVVNYILVARIYRDDKEKFYRFVITDMMSRLVCAIFFIALPTTNVRPVVTGDGISHQMLSFLYRVDQPTNLFPSIHCLVSWLCFAGIRGNRKIPAWYQAFSCVFALMVVLSTQYTKQHYIVDTISGVFLAEVLFQLNKRISIYLYVQRFYEWLHNKISYRFKGETCEQ